MSTSSQSGDFSQTGTATRQRPRVLIVDDDLTLARGLEANLKKEGYDLITASTGEGAIDAAIRRNPDFVILDLMLPDMSGLDVCRALRQSRLDCMIMMLTVKSDEFDRVLGLEIGADDYMTKPFSLRELLARIRAHMRRRPAKSDHSLKHFSFGDVDLDFERCTARKRGKDLKFTAKEIELLRFLVLNRGEVVTRERILEAVWGYDSAPTTRTVDNHILRIRQKLEADPGNPKYILSAYGEGYRFVS